MLQARRRRRRTNTSSSSSSILPNIVYNNMNHHQEDGDGDDCEPPLVVSCIFANFYVISGATQPLLMYSVKDIGLSDPRCQLYMVWFVSLFWNVYNESLYTCICIGISIH